MVAPKERKLPRSGKVCSICTYYESLSSLVEQPSKVLVRALTARLEPEFVITGQQKESQEEGWNGSKRGRGEGEKKEEEEEGKRREEHNTVLDFT